MEVYLGNPGDKLTAWCKAHYAPTPTGPVWGKGKFKCIYKDPSGQDNTATLNWDATHNVYGDNVPYEGSIGILKDDEGVVKLMLNSVTCVIDMTKMSQSFEGQYPWTDIRVTWSDGAAGPVWGEGVYLIEGNMPEFSQDDGTPTPYYWNGSSYVSEDKGGAYIGKDSTEYILVSDCEGLNFTLTGFDPTKETQIINVDGNNLTFTWVSEYEAPEY